MNNKWERRDSKQQSKRKFTSDNRRSIQLIGQLSLLPNKLRKTKRRKFR